MPSNTNLIDRVFSQTVSLISPQSSILAAVSGGGDSTALLFILWRLKEQLGIQRLGVIHVNHGLRGAASDADERFVAGLAKKFDLPFFLKQLSGHSLHDSGMEEWARHERYSFFHEVGKREGYEYIATGHTASDQAETLLFRLMRGTGLRGLRGIQARRDDGVVRPVLGIWSRELRSWLRENDIPFQHDTSNDDRTFSRNRIRHDLLPLLDRREKNASLKLVLIAAKVQEFWKIFGPQIEKWKLTNVRRGADSFRLKKAGLADKIHAPEGLLSVFNEYGIPADSMHLDQISAQAARKSGTLLLPGGWRYLIERNTMLFCKGHPVKTPAFRHVLAVPGRTDCRDLNSFFMVEERVAPAGKIPQDNITVLLDRAVCGDTLTYRSWNDKDRFEPLGSSSSVTVREFLAKQKIASVDRPGTGVVEGKEGRILWIPGVRIAQACRLTTGSRKLLKISYQSCPPII